MESENREAVKTGLSSCILGHMLISSKRKMIGITIRSEFPMVVSSSPDKQLVGS